MRALLALATGLAICLASPSSWAHSFPATRTVVVQVERCEVVLLVGYRPSSGEATEAVLTRAAAQGKSHGLDGLRAALTQQAMAPLSLEIDGVARLPTSVRTKIGAEPGGGRPMIVLLVTYALPQSSKLSLVSKDTRSTRISWADRDSGRVVISDAPAQGKWFAGVASFLLSLAPSSGGPACASSPPSPSSSPRSPR